MATTPGTSPYASLPWPGDASVPDVPSDVKALTDRLETIFANVFGGTGATPMPTAAINPGLLAAAAGMGTFQGQLNSQGTNIATIQGQIATLQSQVATLQSQVTILNRVPVAFAKRYPSYLTINGGMAGTPPILLNTITVPSKTYRQLLVVNAQSTWDQAYDLSTAPLLQQVMLNGAQRSASFQNGFEETLSDFFMETVEAGATSTITHYISLPEYWDSQPAHFWQTLYEQPRLYALAIPWTGAQVLPAYP